MCGIVAIYHPQGRVSGEALGRATARLHHRGPDGQRQWIAPHGRVGLGHARLSIIDLATGDQPIASEDERRRDRRQRRVLRLRADPARAGTGGPPPPHPLRQRDRPAPLRGPGAALPAPAARRVRLRAVGRPQQHALRRPRPLRHQAALLRLARRRRSTSPPRSRPCSRPACPAAGTARGCSMPRSWGPSRRTTLFEGISPGAARPLPARRPAGMPAAPLLGFRLPAGGPGARPTRSDEDCGRGVPAGARRGGPAPAPGRRAGRLLPQRRARLVRRARPGGSAHAASRSAPSR